MYGMFQKTNGIFKLRIFIVIVILLFLFFQLASGRNTSSRRSGSLQSQSQNNPFDSATENFQASLEMKENVDFLLTPALLVQEAISEDVIITYPSE